MKRKLSWLLSLLMVISLIPAGRAGAEEKGWVTQTPSITDAVGGYEIITGGSLQLAYQADYDSLLGNFWILDKQYEGEYDDGMGEYKYVPAEGSEYIREPLWWPGDEDDREEIHMEFDNGTFTLPDSNRKYTKKENNVTGEIEWSPSGQSFSRYSYVPIEFEVMDDRSVIASKGAFYTLDFYGDKHVAVGDYIVSITRKIKNENEKPLYFSESYVKEHPDWMYEFAKIQGYEFSYYNPQMNEVASYSNAKQFEKISPGWETELLAPDSYYADMQHTAEELKKLGIPEAYIAEDTSKLSVPEFAKTGAKSYIRHTDRNGHRAVLAAFFNLPFESIPEDVCCCCYSEGYDGTSQEPVSGCLAVQDIKPGYSYLKECEASGCGEEEFREYEGGELFSALCEMISSNAVTRVEPDGISLGAVEVTSFGALQEGIQYFPVKNVKECLKQPDTDGYPYIEPKEEDGNVLWIPYEEKEFYWPDFSKKDSNGIPTGGLSIKDSRLLSSSTAITAPALELPVGKGILVNNDKRTLDFAVKTDFKESEHAWYFNPSEINRDQTIFFGAAIPEMLLPEEGDEDYVHYRDNSDTLMDGSITGGGIRLDWSKAEIRNNGSPIKQMYIELTGTAIQTEPEPKARLMGMRLGGYTEGEPIDVKKMKEQGRLGTKISIGDVNVKSIILLNLEGTGVDTVNIYAENSVGIAGVPLFQKTNIDSNNYDPSHPKPTTAPAGTDEPVITPQPSQPPVPQPSQTPGGTGSSTSGSGSPGQSQTVPEPSAPAQGTDELGNPDRPVITYDYSTCLVTIQGPEGADLMYKVDDGSYAVYNGPFVLVNKKDYVVTSYAVQKEKRSGETAKDIFMKPATPLIKADEEGKVTLSCATKGADIMYRTDDSGWKKYGKPFQVKDGTRVTAYAVRKEIPSDKASKVITLEKEKEIRLTPYMTVYKTIYRGSRFKVDMINIGKNNETEWTVEDSTIASVSKKGIITAKKAGKTVVSCISTNNGKQYYRYNIVVTVPKEKGRTLSDPQPQNQKFNSRMPVLRMRKVLYPNSHVFFGLKNVEAADSIQYSTSNPEVAVIDKKGVVRPKVRSGSCYVTAKMKFHGQVYYFRMHIVIHKKWVQEE